MDTFKQDKISPRVVNDVDKEEEIIPTVSSPTITSSPSISSSYATTLLGSPVQRRCVSKEMLEQISALDCHTRYDNDVLGPMLPFGCFHVMQVIEKSIQIGAFLTPKLFVPKEIWQQGHVKLVGLSIKIESFHQFKQRFETISHTFPLSSDMTQKAFVNEVDALLDFIRHERIKLSRSFPFLLQDKTNDVVQLTHRGMETEEESADAYSSSSIGKLTNFAFGFGRMVKKQAIAAVERVGAAPFVSVSRDELTEYAAVLCMFFNSTRSIENLLGLRTDADGTQEPIKDSKAQSKSSQLDSATMKKLEDLAMFLDEVVIELVMRDVHSLLDIYLQRLGRQFGEFTIERAVSKRHPSVST